MAKLIGAINLREKAVLGGFATRMLFTALSVLLLYSPCSAAKDNLVFGAIAVGKVSEVRESLSPFLRYLESEIGVKVSFETGKDYLDTIEKFRSGYFDFGYIGPSPYIIATQGESGPDNFRIIATLETKGQPFFNAVIIAARDNAAINSIEDLKGKRFAFGSRQSTLSCYMPCKMLMDSGILDTLAAYEFLGKHDKVVRDVSMGSFDAGAIKEDVASENMDKIKVIAKSLPVYDFLLVAHKSMDPALVEKIRAAVLELKDPAILKPIQTDVTGFAETKDSNYDNLRTIMKEVDQKLGPAQK
ncbi:MAG: phosphate/phosphite/phosphonate ABC transporter substrate-binding protein [Syntrophobacteraceae bacterium]